VVEIQLLACSGQLQADYESTLTYNSDVATTVEKGMVTNPSIRRAKSCDVRPSQHGHDQVNDFET
jgi:hypothetical protein